VKSTRTIASNGLGLVVSCGSECACAAWYAPVECSSYKQPGSANFLPVVSRDAGSLPLQTLKLDNEKANNDNREDAMLQMMQVWRNERGQDE
jgi:hypothetical protein